MLSMSSKASIAAGLAALLPRSAFATDEYGGYSGNKDFKFIKAPATVYDFGLTPDQEAHAKELHKKLVVFDCLMECSSVPKEPTLPSHTNHRHGTSICRTDSFSEWKIVSESVIGAVAGSAANLAVGAKASVLEDS